MVFLRIMETGGYELHKNKLYEVYKMVMEELMVLLKKTSQ